MDGTFSVPSGGAWLTLFAPALFALVVGGGYWAYCAHASPSPNDTAEKFSVYSWLILPIATLAYAALLWSWTPDAISRWGLSAPTFLDTGTGVAAGVVIGLATTGVLRRFYSRSITPDESGHFAVGIKDLPSLLVVAPLSEEIIFRGAGHDLMAPLGSTLAAVVTALAFAMMHVKPALMAMAFVAGLAFSTVYNVTGTLWAPIIAHAIANLFSWFTLRQLAREAAA